MSTEEKRHFLEDYEGHGSSSVERDVKSKRKWNWMLAVSMASNIILLTTCILLTIRYHQTIPARKGSELAEPYSPANVAIEYEYRNVVKNDSRYTGYPSAEWKGNMDKLMAGTLIRLSEEELELAGTDSIPLKDGDYAGSIGVGHNLHCIKKIKHYLYPDYFMPDVDPHSNEMMKHRDHADHCLDWLRQGVMCYVDPTVYTMFWENPIRPTHKMPGVQKCVNWDKLHDWMNSRSTSIYNFVRQEDIEKTE